MSWSINVVGRDKAKLKENIRAQQCKDEEKNPHTGVPKRVADHLCSEVDRARIYSWEDRTYGLSIVAHGSFHEQGMNETITICAIQLAE